MQEHGHYELPAELPIDLATLPPTFSPKGKVYDSGNPRLGSTVTVQAPSLASIGDSMGMNHISDRELTESIGNIERGQKAIDELFQQGGQNTPEQIIE